MSIKLKVDCIYGIEQKDGELEIRILPQERQIRDFLCELMENYGDEKVLQMCEEVAEITSKDRIVELTLAAKNLRNAQKAYMADRGNDELGKEVAKMALALDQVLDDKAT